MVMVVVLGAKEGRQPKESYREPLFRAISGSDSCVFVIISMILSIGVTVMELTAVNLYASLSLRLISV